MANHFSALKRQRQNTKRAERNRTARSRLRHAIREMRRALSSKDPAKAKTMVSATVSIIDKAVKKRVVRENTASRFKSRLMTRLRQVSAG
jgi:small subunit ribosomal protein S20